MLDRARLQEGGGHSVSLFTSLSIRICDKKERETFSWRHARNSAAREPSDEPVRRVGASIDVGGGLRIAVTGRSHDTDGVAVGVVDGGGGDRGQKRTVQIGASLDGL